MLSKCMFSLIVRDYDEALDFYTRKLGLVVAEDIPMGEDRWITLTAPGDQGWSIALHRAKHEGDESLIGRQGGGFPLFGLETDDCATEYLRLKELGVRFDSEPEAQPWGTGAVLQDPYGNRIYLNEEPKEAFRPA